ncbi:lysozyme-like [Harmonia axyridis]|uniref:lysozyme-like n=1 Tax=Harmonia axyridis TaxID=115357 RepID=UPI001E27541C|nr:lysozyme-like [Harmonia axyridis]
MSGLDESISITRVAPKKSFFDISAIGTIMKIFVLGLFVVVFCANVEGKVYTKCGLTNELITLNFPRTFIGNWVCLIESESGKNTSRITNRANGKQGVGLFQIKSKDWCTFGKKGGTCNVKCEDMLDENIKDDGVCAEKVKNEFGFLAWDGWKRSCKGRNLPLPPC